MRKTKLLSWITVGLTVSFVGVLPRAEGDIVGTAFDATSIAEVATLLPVEVGSSDSSDNLFATVGGSALFPQTDASLDYNWDGVELTATSLIKPDRFLGIQPILFQNGSSDLEFSFTVDQATNWSIDGTYGYTGVTGTDDELSWTLMTSDDTVIDSGTALAISSDVNAQVFNGDGILEAGDYKLQMKAELNEFLPLLQPKRAGFTLNRFALTAVPEPSSAILLSFGLLGLVTRRRRV